jgi:hypothetical protein
MPTTAPFSPEDFADAEDEGETSRTTNSSMRATCHPASVRKSGCSDCSWTFSTGGSVGSEGVRFRPFRGRSIG